MSVVIQVDVQQSRADVAALNAEIRSIAGSAAGVKNAFGGDIAGDMMAQLQAIQGQMQAIRNSASQTQNTLSGINSSLAQTGASGRTAAAGVGSATSAIGGMAPAAQRAASGTNALKQSITGLHIEANSAQREIGVLIGELLRGNFGQFERSTVTLSRQLGVLRAAFTTVAGLGVVALVLAIGSVIALAVSANNELANFNKSLVITGNTANTTGANLVQMANNVGQSTGHWIDAKNAVEGLARSGTLTGQALQDVSIGVVSYANLTGESIENSLKLFQQLGDNPVKTLMKLNEQWNFLTVAQRDQIQGLEILGNKIEAGIEAQKLFADTSTQRDAEYKTTLKGWALLWTVISDKIGEAAARSGQFISGIMDKLSNSGAASTALSQVAGAAAGPLTALLSYFASTEATDAPKKVAAAISTVGDASKDATKLMLELTAGDAENDAKMREVAATYKLGKAALEEFKLGLNTLAIAQEGAKKGWTTEFIEKQVNALYAHKQVLIDDAKAADAMIASTKLNKSVQNELSSELGGIIKQFDKATDSSADYTHQFDELNRISAALQSGHLDKELAKIGATATEAQAALNWQAQEDTFNVLKNSLTDLNPLFKGLVDPTKDLKNESNDLGDAYATVDQWITKLSAKYPELSAQIHKTGEELKTQLPDILDGSTQALAQFDIAVRDQQKNLNAAFKVDGLNEFINQVQESGRTLDATSIGAQALAAANVALGGSMKTVQKALGDVTDSQLTANNLQQIWIDLQNDPVMQAAPARLEAYGRALQNVYNQTQIGALQLANQNIKNQIDLIAGGTQNLTVYSELWKLTKGGILAVTPAMQQAAEAQAALNEQFAKMQAVQQSFKSFASSLGDAFAKFFTDTHHSFKSFVDDIKSSFKQLLFDMIKQAAMNQILFYFGFNGSGAGGGGGSLGGIIGLFSNLLGGGSGSSGGGVDLGSLAGAAAVGNASAPGSQFYNLGYNPTGMAGGDAGGGIMGGIGAANQLYQVGQFGYNVYSGGVSGAFANATNQYSGLINGTGRTLPGSSYFGSSVYGPGMDTSFAPTALGYGTAVAGGLYAGYNRYQNGYGGAWSGAAGATYAVGGTALGLGIAGAASGAGFAAGVGSMAAGASAAGAGAGLAAAVPVIGWIALALMLIDMATGGGLFGTKANKFIGGATDLGYSDGAASLSGHYTMKGKKPLFQGSYYKESAMPISPEMQAQADATANQINQFGKAQAARLGVAMATGITGNFEAQFDKNGNVTKSISTVLGKTYEEPLEDFVKRMQAETLTAEIGESLAAMGANASEAQTLADRFRASASTFLDAAQFMEAAQIDIKNGSGLLREAGGAGVLTDTVDIVQQLQLSGETLTQTYTRLVAETGLVSDIMNTTGSSFTKSGKDFVTFADDFVNAMGGLDVATASWAAFSQQILGGTAQISSATSSGALAGQLKALGLSADTTISQFAAAFKQVAGSLDASTLAQWVQAGAAMATIQQTMEVMQGLADGVDISSLLNQQAQLVASINQQISMAAKLGASEQQLAEMRRLGQQAIDRQLGNFMGGIEDQIQKLQGGDYAYQLRVIHEQMLQNIDSARALGASEADLAQVQKLAALQTAAVIAQLKNSIADLVKQLHGTSNSQQQQLQQTAHAGQTALHQAQQDLYTAAQRAIKDIKQFLDSLQTGDLSPLDYHAQLDAAQSQFNDLVTRAQHGDTDAMAQLTQAAQTYLQEAQGDYGNSATYGQIFQQVTDTLRQLQAQFATIAQPPPEATGGGGSGSGSSSHSSLSADDRAGLAIQIAQQIGALGLALNVSVFDLMDKFGVSIGELASDMGINIAHMSDETVNGLVILAAALHISTTDLLNALGAQPAAIGAYFQVTADQINAGNFANIKAMADALGISVFDAITYVGGNLQSAIEAQGITLDALTGDMIISLGAIATTLGVSIFDLLTQLNVGIAQFAGPLADAITADLAAIPDLAQSTIDGLAPLLIELGTAITQGDLDKALGDINAYLATLPQDQRDKLEGLFHDLGININDSTNAISDQTDTQTQTANNTLDMVSQQSFTNNTLVSMKTTAESQLVVLQAIGTALGAHGVGDVGPGGSGRGGGDGRGGGRTLPGGGRGRSAQDQNVFVIEGDAMMTIPGATQLHTTGPYGPNSESSEDLVNAPAERLQRTVQQQTATQRQHTGHLEDISESLQQTNQRLAVLTGVVGSKLDRSHDAQQDTNTNIKGLTRQTRLKASKRTVKSS